MQPPAGIVGGGLPQLPLTALNSVVAVCQLSGDLFPGREARPALVAASVGLMNLVGPWLGALPCCHGAGGLAAQVLLPKAPASQSPCLAACLSTLAVPGALLMLGMRDEAAGWGSGGLGV